MSDSAVSSSLAPPPGLMLIHGNRMEELCALALGWLRRQPLAPLQSEHWLVQSQGMAQWLKLALAADAPSAAGSIDVHGGLGIAAAARFWLPADFLWQMYRQALGLEQVPPVSPLDHDMLLWRLLQRLPELMDDPGFQPLQRFLSDDATLRKRYQLAQQLAKLYDQYQVYRADWLNDWATGRDRLADLRGGHRPLPATQRWQAELWRLLLAELGTQTTPRGRAETHQAFLQHLASCEQAPLGLPQRLLVFGISSLPAQMLEALAALGRFVQIQVYLHNPSRFYWGDIVADRDLLRHAYRRHPQRPDRAIDPAAPPSHGHPLLASWGKQGRDLIHLLDVHDRPDDYRSQLQPLNGGRIDLFQTADTSHLLAQLQDDMLELRDLAETRARWPAVDIAKDHSIRFHIAHGEQRELEILHDQLLARFAADPSLRPGEIIVMVPDIDRYVPHIRAVFGRLDRDDPRHIPFHLADQRLDASEPLFKALSTLLAVPESRFPVSEVLDLLETPALRARFGLQDEDLPNLRRWVQASGIRWGLDGTQRSPFGLAAHIEQNSWRFGLQRMLLGYAVGAGEAFLGIDPYAETGGLEAALLGLLDQLLRALDQTRQELAEAAPPHVWGQRLHALLERFFIPQTAHEESLLAQLTRKLDAWLERCQTIVFKEPVPLDIVRDTWLTALEHGDHHPFLGGSVQFCSLLPMRAIPFRIVCLLGMQDDAYPRRRPAQDFDLMAGDYRPGDRSRREDDRYLWLEALLSAREQLYLSWIGHGLRDGEQRPPSVLLAQLCDHLNAGWTLAVDPSNKPPKTLSQALTVDHPLQAFSPRYFQAADDDSKCGLFSYAKEWLAAPTAQALDKASAPSESATDVATTLSIKALARFLRYPAEQYFVQRLHTYLPTRPDIADDQEPFDLHGLARDRYRQDLLQAMLAAPISNAETSIEQMQHEARRWQTRGELPLAGFGELTSTTLAAPLYKLATPLAACSRHWPQKLELRSLVYNDGPLRLEAQLELRQGARDMAIFAPGTRNLDYGKSHCRWDRLIAPWLCQLIACACHTPVTLLVLAPDVQLQCRPLNAEQARVRLSLLLAGWRAGMQRPLSITARTAFAWLQNESSPAAVQKAYNEELKQQAALQREYPDCSALLADGSFAHWAEQLYRPLIDAGWQRFDPAAEGSP